MVFLGGSDRFRHDGQMLHHEDELDEYLAERIAIGEGDDGDGDDGNIFILVFECFRMVYPLYRRVTSSDTSLWSRPSARESSLSEFRHHVAFHPTTWYSERDLDILTIKKTVPFARSRFCIIFGTWLLLYHETIVEFASSLVSSLLSRTHSWILDDIILPCQGVGLRRFRFHGWNSHANIWIGNEENV